MLFVKIFLINTSSLVQAGTKCKNLQTSRDPYRLLVSVNVVFVHNSSKLSAFGESTSEPDLTTAGRYPWPAGFPPGFTVDELRWYRKKKPPGDWEPRDTLKPEEGSMKKFKSEYKRCYKKFHFLPASSEDLSSTSQDDLVQMSRPGRPSDYLKLEGDIEFKPEYKDLYVEYPSQRPRVTKPKSQFQTESGSMDVSSEQHEKFIPHQNFPRTQLARRSSSLQRDGDFMVKSSEMHSQFVKYDDAKKADLSRRPTSLRMEGEMAVTSETAEKFIEFLIGQRPDLAKFPNSLKLEGDMNVLTEKSEKYVPFELPKRLSLNKQQTNLHLEGPMDIQTEQKEKFIAFNVQDRPTLAKRDTNLHLLGEMDIQTEKQEKFVPFNVEKRTPLAKRDTNLRLEGDMILPDKKEKYVPFDVQQQRPPLAKKETNLQLEGELIMTPEYRDMYIEYQSERPKPKRPINNLGLVTDEDADVERKRDKFFTEYQKPFRNFESSLRFDGAHEMKPVYKENYVPHRLEKTLSRKPKENLKPEGPLELTTESQTKFTEHDVTKPEMKKATHNLQLEGQLEINPEYKNKYVSFPRERPKVIRPTEQINSQEIKQKRTRNYAQPVGNLRSEGQMESNPEYRSSYVDFPRERPVVRKPPNTFKTNGHVPHLSEKEAQYIEYGYVPKASLVKPEDELKMDGKLECQPEYRKAYIDLLTRENIARKSRPFDTSGQRLYDALFDELVGETIQQKDKHKSISPREKQKSSKSSKGTKADQTSGKSRSVSPDRRRKTRQVPRTPKQEVVLVPDLSGQPSRRPSSIFGQKTVKWTSRPRYTSSSCRPSHCSDDEIDADRHTPVHCLSKHYPEPEHLHPCSRSMSSWQSPCARRQYSQCSASISSPRMPSPSPPRRKIWNKEHQSRRDDKPASFVVLTDKVEINNNRLTDQKPKGYSGCCKEQKWMPPWYEPPM